MRCPGSILGVPAAGDCGGWLSLRIRFTPPPASPVTVVLLQVFSKGAMSENTFSEMTQGLYET